MTRIIVFTFINALLVLATLLMACFGPFSLEANAQENCKEIVAERIVLVDSAGNTRMELAGNEYSSYITLMNQGNDVLRLLVNDEGCSIELNGYNSSISVSNNTSSNFITIKSDEENGSIISIGNLVDTSSIELSQSAGGCQIGLSSISGDHCTIGSIDGSSLLELNNEKEQGSSISLFVSGNSAHSTILSGIENEVTSLVSFDDCYIKIKKMDDCIFIDSTK